MSPPIAGPAENPKFIANRINVNDRILFSGLLYACISSAKSGLI